LSDNIVLQLSELSRSMNWLSGCALRVSKGAELGGSQGRKLVIKEEL